MKILKFLFQTMLKWCVLMSAITGNILDPSAKYKNKEGSSQTAAAATTQPDCFKSLKIGEQRKLCAQFGFNDKADELQVKMYKV